MGFLVALQFLTIIPPLRPREPQPGELGRSMAYFPAVGLLLGLVLAALDYALARFLPVGVVGAVVVLGWVLLTGGLHLDGLMDVCDGVFSQTEPARRLEVMSDSRVGSYGVLGAFGLLLLKYALVVALPGAWRLRALMLAPVLGRWAMVFATWAFPYARPQGLGRAFKDSVGWVQVLVASLASLAVAALALRELGVGAVAAAALVAWLLGLYFRANLGGLTGDTYGATNEVVEVVSLLVLVGARGLYA